MRVLGLIPARGGSKGILRKNVRPLGGRPLLSYTIDSALAATRLARIVLSTEADEIATMAKALGAEVPFRRPDHLASDDAPMYGVVRHAIESLQDQGDRLDAICLLQPTNPFRPTGLIDSCIDLLERTGVDCVATVVPVPVEDNPHWVYLKGPDGYLRLSTGEDQPITRRQDLPYAYRREGSVYVSRVEAVLNKGSLYGDSLAGFEVEAATTVNIDEPEDWARAEQLLSTGQFEMRDGL